MRLRPIQLLMSLFISLVSLSAFAENVGYRVTSADKTLIQIARDAYKDERLWKKIAQWNNIQAPYTLKKGQVVVLPFAPTQAIAAQNLVTGAEVPTPTPKAPRASVEQKLVLNKKEAFYVVNERAPSLWMVARELYGNQKMGPVIAKWNQLPKNSKLALGQVLKLKLAPTQTLKTGTGRLIEVWTQLGNADMVVRLGGDARSIAHKTNAKPSETPPPETASAVAMPAEVAEPVSTPAPAATQNTVVAPVPTPTKTPASVETPTPVKKETIATETPATTVVTEPATQATVQPVQQSAQPSNKKEMTPDQDPELASQNSATATKSETPVSENANTTVSSGGGSMVVPSAPAVTTPTVTIPSTTPATTSTSATKTATDPAATPIPTPAAPATSVSTPTPAVKPEEATPTTTQPTTPETAAAKTPEATPAADRTPASATNPDDGLEPKEDAYWLGEEMNQIMKNINNKINPEKPK